MLRNIHFQKWNKDRYNFVKTIYEIYELLLFFGGEGESHGF